MQSIKVRKIFVVTIIVALVLGTTVGAFAANNLQSITAYLNSGIKIVYNGNVQDLKDGNGNKVVPITYNGTTYVPLRAISNILGEEVNWDSSSNSVILGNYERQPVSPVTLSDFTSKSTNISVEYTATSSNSPFSYSMSTDILKDEEGYLPSPLIGLYSDRLSSAGTDAYTDPRFCATIKFKNLDGLTTFNAKYKTLKHYALGVDSVSSRIIAIDQQDRLLFEQVVPGNGIYEDISFDISGVTELTIRVTDGPSSLVSASAAFVDLKLE